MATLPPDIRSRLELIKIADPDLDVGAFPNFLLIGPQRTGTTWLAKNLARHPEVFIPAAKELFFFYRHQAYWPSYLPPFEDDLAWYLKFFEQTDQEKQERERQQLQQFGERFTVRARGEATASYAVGMTDEMVLEARSIQPDLKVVVLVRDPIERAWSHLKKDLARDRGKSITEIQPGEVEAFLGNWFYRRCGMFTELVDRWRRLLGAERVHVDRFADIANDPLSLLERVFAFLGVAIDRRFVDHSVVAERIERTEDADVPPNVREMLTELYAEELERLRPLGFNF